MNDINKSKKQEQISNAILEVFEYYKNSLSGNELLYKSLNDFRLELQEAIKNNIDFKIRLDFFILKDDKKLIYFLHRKDTFDNSGLLKYDELSNFEISFLRKKSIDLKDLCIHNKTLNIAFRHNDYGFEGSSFNYSFDVFDLTCSDIESIVKKMIF